MLISLLLLFEVCSTESHFIYSEPLQRVAVMINHEKAEFLVCTLDNKHHFQQPLDLNFTEGEEVTFFLNGQGGLSSLLNVDGI